MPLHGYGLLIGKVVSSRPQRQGTPHWLLMVQAGTPNHPPYRVAVNLQSTAQKNESDLQYQIVKFDARRAAGSALIAKLKRIGMTLSFLTKASDPDLPALDFVRGGFLDPKKFLDLPARSNPLHNAFEKALGEITSGKAPESLVAVFGTGYPVDPVTKRSVPTGFTGVENIHMNQGARNLVNSGPYYLENGPNQDGGLIFLSPSGATGFFVKFRDQTVDTDAEGNPTDTGVAEIDKTPPAVRRAIMPVYRRRLMMAARRRDARRTATPGAARRSPGAAASPKPAPGKQNANGYLFADLDPNDAAGKYIPDDDSGTFKTPYVMERSSGHTRGPVPAPRSYPTMDLSTVTGANPQGYTATSSGKSIAFDIVGDSGAPSEQKLNEYEVKVTQLMSRDAAASPPAFLFHVGDVVYFYGEQDYYYSQFYEPFRAYPAPIFAIPGNHDAITFNDTMVSLGPFQKAFCADTPGRWDGAGAILRSTMTQPGVYFTLNAPLVSIIGLYSNCGESFGWCDDQQLMFLYQELTRLKKLRNGGLPAVILAIHHFPRWFPEQKPKDPNSVAIDAACKKAGFWPDAVICGHAHLYQRVVRQDTGQDIPYLVIGAGGYAVNPGQEVGKQHMKEIAAQGKRLSFLRFESGYARATVSSPANGDPTLRFEYRSVKPAGNGPDDICTVNLRTGKIV